MTKDHATVAQLVEQWNAKADEQGELGREYEHRDLIRSAHHYTEAASYRFRAAELQAALAQGGVAVYPNSDRGLKQMCPGVPVATLRGIQEAAFRAGRESVLTPLAQGGAHEPPCVCQFDDGLVQEWMAKVREVARSKGWTGAASGWAQGWQPIATAPKDGSWFLGWNADCGHIVYRDGPGLIAGEDPEPTHWMPLPVPPTGETR